jgi:high affinity Mn2+ porin
MKVVVRRRGIVARFTTLLAGVIATVARGEDAPSNGETKPGSTNWNWHAQATGIVQYHPGYHVDYAGPNSLSSANEVRETLSFDVLLGARLWRGAEAHVDGLMWQGYGLSDTRGVEGFPSGEAFRLGTDSPNVNFSRVFVRQTIGLGGESEAVEDGPLQLASRQDVSRVTLTLGRLSAKDIFDNNAYANDPRTQFMNWGLMANEAWDYPADSLGFTTGMAAELNQSAWTLRYGFFQVPKFSNGVNQDQNYLNAWAMVTELEIRYTMKGHPGATRLLAYVNRANMGSYSKAVENPARPADIQATRDYRTKYGFGLNSEQEITKSLGAFLRLGWSDGQNEAWMFSDVDMSASLGISLKGDRWSRPQDTVGLGGVLNGISQDHKDFLQAGGTGILAGDGGLNYGWEGILETYYDFQIWGNLHGAFDYQFINNPAFNKDRGPVSVFSARLHWAF